MAGTVSRTIIKLACANETAPYFSNDSGSQNNVLTSQLKPCSLPLK